MRRVLVTAVVLVLVGWVGWQWRGETDPQEATPIAPKDAMPQSRPKPPETVKPGDAILNGYAAAAGTVEQDLRMMAAVLSNFALLLKGDDPLPLGANEELAAALLGKNRAQLGFLMADSSALNGAGQLVDRWGSPLFFHARDRQRIDIRSAGPDRQMWTADDVHRLHDGRFLRGEELNAPSLFEASELPGSGR